MKHKYYKTQDKPDRVNNFKIPFGQDCCSMSCPGIHARLVVVPGHLCDWCHLIGGSVNLFLEDVPQLVWHLFPSHLKGRDTLFVVWDPDLRSGRANTAFYGFHLSFIYLSNGNRSILLWIGKMKLWVHLERKSIYSTTELISTPVEFRCRIWNLGVEF